MATVIQNPHHSHESPLGTILGMVVLLIMMVLFFLYVIPYISNIAKGPQISIPSSIDVNVQQQPK